MGVSDVIADAALIGTSAAFLWHFSNIWRYGQYLVAEPNIAIRSLETAGLLVIFIFGISKYIGGIKRNRKNRQGREK